MEVQLNNIAGYGFAVVPLIIFALWTWKGNWYTYDLGIMVMVGDLGLWLIDWPNSAHHIFHSLDVTTSGWRWYFTCAEYLVLVMMTWRGFKIIWNLFKGEEVRDR
jgi:hypothetical protein